MISFLLVIFVNLIHSHQVLGQIGCSGDFGKLVEPCWNFVSIEGPIVPPSPQCCSSVQSVNVPCVCQQMIEKDEKVLSMQKIVYVAAFCGKPLPPGSKCGSK